MAENPPDRHIPLAGIGLVNVNGDRLSLSVSYEGGYPTVLRLIGGLWRLEIPPEQALRLLSFGEAHFGMPAPFEPRPVNERLVIRVELVSPAHAPGRRIAEACRLLGIALARLEAGDTCGQTADPEGTRRVQWSVTPAFKPA